MQPTFDRDTSRIRDSNGWYEIKGNPISKVGVFPYRGAQISDQLDPDKIYMVYRPAEELSASECIDSFKLLPWTDLHPNKLLGPQSSGRMPAENKGIHGVIGEDVYFDFGSGLLKGNIKLFSDDLDGKIEDGVRELSAGYGCTYEVISGMFNGQQYDAIQRNIRGNHLASVPEGRMGPDVAVLDQKILTFTMDAKDLTMPDMTEEEKMKKECADRAAADGFKRYSRDAEEEEKEKKEKEAADKMAKDKMAKDAEEEEKKKEKEAADKAAKDAEESEKEKKDKDGMDAQITSLRTELAAVKQDGFKSFARQVAKRDEVYGRVSPFVGAFDHAELNAEEVAKYALDKLEIKCVAGTEMAALDGYLKDRVAPIDEVGFALDTRQTPAKSATGTPSLDRLVKSNQKAA